MDSLKDNTGLLGGGWDTYVIGSKQLPPKMTVHCKVFCCSLASQGDAFLVESLVVSVFAKNFRGQLNSHTRTHTYTHKENISRF